MVFKNFTINPTPRIGGLLVCSAFSFGLCVDGVGVNSLGFEWIDKMFLDYSFLPLLFTLLVVGGTVNSLNIIDSSLHTVYFELESMNLKGYS